MSKIVFSEKTGYFSRKTLGRVMQITFISALVNMSISLLFLCNSFVSFSLQNIAFDQTLHIWLYHLKCEAVSEVSTAVRMAVLASLCQVDYCKQSSFLFKTSEEVSNIMKMIITKKVCGGLILAGSWALTLSIFSPSAWLKSKQNRR